MQSEIEIKTERLTKMLSAENLGGVLINAQHNFAWLTGGKSNAVNTATENGASYLFVRADGKKFLLANNIEMPRMLAEEISADEFEPVEFSWTDEKTSADFVFQQSQSLMPNAAAIASDLPLNSNFRAIENLLAPCRYSLTEQEIVRVKSLGNDAGIALGKVFEQINTGETELEIAQITRSALAEFDIQSLVTLVGADERISQFRHPVPTTNVWKKIILIAVCARREGLIVNLSRIACAGEIPAKLQDKTVSAARVCGKILSQTKNGKTGAELYETAKKSYAEIKFADEILKHHQGGATGYKTRDWVAHPKSNETVKNNQAFAWNPSITGTKIEETVISRENEIEIITATPDFPQIEVEIEERKYLLPGILSL